MKNFLDYIKKTLEGAPTPVQFFACSDNFVKFTEDYVRSISTVLGKVRT